jgi:type VI secretion system secreted protein VgrG
VLVTAAGGVTFVAPGGTKFVDFQFNKLGGLSSETYGTKLDNFSLKVEATLGAAITYRTINLQKALIDNKTVAAKLENLGARMEKSEAAIVQRAANVIKAGATIFM